MKISMAAAFVVATFASGAASANAADPDPVETTAQKIQRVAKSVEGSASWYASGHRTANGERFRKLELTAAHRTLGFGTKARITNLRNGESVVVRINDRGPFAKNRLIDLSLGAAKRIGMVDSGTAKVRMEVLR